jgi:hypothetical protein
MLLGASGGGLIGSAVDKDRAIEADGVFESLAKTIKPGTTAVVAQVEEPDEEVIDGEMEELGVPVTRRPVAEAKAEIAAAEDAALAAQEDAQGQGAEKGEVQGESSGEDRIAQGQIEQLTARLGGAPKEVSNDHATRQHQHDREGPPVFREPTGRTAACVGLREAERHAARKELTVVRAHTARELPDSQAAPPRP